MNKAPENTVIDLLKDETNNELAVASTGTVYTDYFALPRSGSFGLDIQLSSAGTVDVTVELEEGNTPPASQAADSAWAVGDTLVSNLAVTTSKQYKVTPVVAKYGRLKFKGNGSNAASTKVVRCLIALTGT